MVRYEEIEGDLLELYEQNMFYMIGHGCNCQNIMNAGIAKQIKDNYPEAYYVDRFYNLTSSEKLGNYSLVFDDNLIANIYSQYNPGKNLDYEALTLALRKLNMNHPNCKIGLPQIGCGIGGGNWDKVKKIIQEELKDMYVTIVIYKK